MTVTMSRMSRRAAMGGAAAAVAVLAQAAPAAAADVAPIPRSWAASMDAAHASGYYTVTQAPLGVQRTYQIGGLLINDAAGQCYFVRVSAGSAPGQDSTRSCGPTQPVRIDVRQLAPLLSTPVSVQVCRDALVSEACGAAVRLP